MPVFPEQKVWEPCGVHAGRMGPSFLCGEEPYTVHVGRDVVHCLGAEKVEPFAVHAGKGRDQFSWYRGHGDHMLFM